MPERSILGRGAPGLRFAVRRSRPPPPALPVRRVGAHGSWWNRFLGNNGFFCRADLSPNRFESDQSGGGGRLVPAALFCGNQERAFIVIFMLKSTTGAE